MIGRAVHQPDQFAPVGSVGPFVAKPKLLGRAERRDTYASARGGKALHGKDGVDCGKVLGNPGHCHAAQEPWGVPAVVEEFDMAHVDVGERHHHEVDFRVVVDADARSNDDRRGGAAADNVAGDRGERVGDDVGNEGHGAIKVLLIANVGVRKGDVNDASTRVPHWAEGGRIADPRGD